MKNSPDKNGSPFRGTLVPILGSLAMFGASGVALSYQKAVEQPCSANEQIILDGIDVFHRRQAESFQTSYDFARKQLPELPEMNFQELGFNASQIIEESKDAEPFCVERTWPVDLVESIQGITVGDTWDLRSDLENRRFYIKPELFDGNICGLVSGVIHEDIHLAKFGSEHDGVDTLEEAMQNPHFNYEQSAEVRCNELGVTHDDLLSWGLEAQK